MKAGLLCGVIILIGRIVFAEPVCDPTSIETAAEGAAVSWNILKTSLSSKDVMTAFQTSQGISWTVPGSIYGDQISVLLDIPCTTGDCRVSYVWADEAKLAKPASRGSVARLRGHGSYLSTCKVNVTQRASRALGLQEGQCSCVVSIDHVANGSNGSPIYGAYDFEFRIVPSGSSYQLRAFMISHSGGTPPWETVEAKCTGSLKSANGVETCGTDHLNTSLYKVCDDHLDGLRLILNNELPQLSSNVSCQ